MLSIGPEKHDKITKALCASKPTNKHLWKNPQLPGSIFTDKIKLGKNNQHRFGAFWPIERDPKDWRGKNHKRQRQ